MALCSKKNSVANPLSGNPDQFTHAHSMFLFMLIRLSNCLKIKQEYQLSKDKLSTPLLCEKLTHWFLF